MTDAILVLNAGSSSIKFGIYALQEAGPVMHFRGKAHGLGTEAAGLEARDRDGQEVLSRSLPRSDHETALDGLLQWLDVGMQGLTLRGVGHRVVHGGRHHPEPVLLDDSVLRTLDTLTPLAPLHQPQNLAPIRRMRAELPAEVSQVACFDTVFHRSQPNVAQLFALPRKYAREGVIRYGFHGLSYQYISRWLADNRPALHAGRVLVAHLGSGASLCGLHDGRSIATTMGFSALDGLVMGQRCGTLDPGVVLYLMDHYGMTVADIEDLLYNRSGLLGLSGISHDVRELLASKRPEAREALAVYCYRAVREIGSISAALRGLDALVFTAGVGENAAHVRWLICEQLQWLGIHLDEAANNRHATEIGSKGSLPVLVVPTDEEWEIACETARKIE